MKKMIPILISVLNYGIMWPGKKEGIDFKAN